VNFGSVLAVHTDDKKIVLGADAGKSFREAAKSCHQSRGKKLTVLKFKKGQSVQDFARHRQNYTAVQVSDISCNSSHSAGHQPGSFSKRITSWHIRRAAAPQQTAAIHMDRGWA